MVGIYAPILIFKPADLLTYYVLALFYMLANTLLLPVLLSRVRLALLAQVVVCS